MIGDSMALILWLTVAQQFTSVRSIARAAYKSRTDRETELSHTALRPYERAVNRCQLAGLLGDNYRPTDSGLMALAQTERGQAVSGTAMGIQFSSDAYDRIRPLVCALLQLAANENESARVTIAFLYWHGRQHGPSHDRARAAISLGGKVGGDRRQTSLPLDVPGLDSVDRASTGALPQPPYTTEYGCVCLKRHHPNAPCPHKPCTHKLPQWCPLCNPHSKEYAHAK